MITYQRTAGTTDVSVVIRIIDSTDGTPETGVVFNTSGIDLEYRREGEASTDITEATLAALTTAHTDGGFLHIGNGYYRLDLPDAACATGVTGVLVHGTVTGMVVIGCYVQLVTYNPFDSVRLGLTALPNAAADAAGGLPISDAGGLDLDAKLANTNEVTAARMGALTDWINGGRLDLILDELTTQGDTNETKLDTIDNFLDTEIAAILAAVDTEVAAILADTDVLQTEWADGGRLDLILDARASQTSVNTIDDFLDTEVAAILAAVDTEVASIVTTLAGLRVKKNTALAKFEFVMIDSTDHLTPKTGLTVTATRSIDGAALGACANAVTELSNGIYIIDLAASDLNGNVITFRFTATGADDRLITVITSD